MGEAQTNVKRASTTTCPLATTLDHHSLDYNSKNDNAVAVLVPTELMSLSYPGVLEQKP